jgi:hypothetical protein
MSLLRLGEQILKMPARLALLDLLKKKNSKDDDNANEKHRPGGFQGIA